MFDIPADPKRLISFTMEQIEACTVSQGMRAAYCRQVDAILESGKRDGGRSLLNLLPAHIDRLASHLYSPTDLRFTIDFENDYPANILKQGKTASRILTRDFERSNADMKFGLGVNEALKYGAAILKQWVQQEGQDKHPVYYTDLVMPWQFGVYREDINDITRQPVLCETSMLTLPEIWRRIWHLPNAEQLFNRIKGQSSVGSGGDLYNSFFHQVLFDLDAQHGQYGAKPPNAGWHRQSQQRSELCDHRPADPGAACQVPRAVGAGRRGLRHDSTGRARHHRGAQVQEVEPADPERAE